ncbi:unnamed protein product [Echinostoma caproni]|uniref:VWFA domain-containing protein n=1 Tax=Echinostoma caproni TaxID=27848 RepID=A0A3P8KX41_9TREM|nr:unnamed protein product [Echinostoma caproni]
MGSVPESDQPQVSGFQFLLFKSAATWIKSLNCGGSTNTFAGLQFALADCNATGIYLLSDGRPDQDPRSILLSMQLNHPLPIHTVSFNCSDPEANQFLKQLAQITGGRFHCFSHEPRHPADADPWELPEDTLIVRCESEYLELTAPNEQPKTAAQDPGSVLFHVLNPTLMNSKEIGREKSVKNAKVQPKTTTNDAYYSLLNALCQKAATSDSEEFVLVETKELLDRQARRYEQAVKTELKQAQKARESVKRTEPELPEPLSIPTWIARYGLRAQELRPLDLIAPVAVPLRFTFIPVLKRRITSEVLRQTMPLAVISKTKPSGQPKVRLVNPQAIDFAKYERDLGFALKRIEGQLVKIISEFLNRQHQQRLRSLTGLGDISRWRNRLCWYQHREVILDVFRQSGWPFPPDELRRLTKELDKVSDQ